jgi:5-methylcytosine-specific restriction endonuclease McrA
MTSTADQIQFLLNIQRLLNGGQFSATYKYALLTALADLAVELGSDSGAEMELSIREIAEKVTEYYWRQAAPYAPLGPANESSVLLQNSDRQAAVIGRVAEFRKRYGDSLPEARRLGPPWKSLVRGVAKIVETMPLWKLQTVGRTTFDFLYENRGSGSSITLRPGVAYCLRQFHGMITELVRSAWLRQVRQCNQLLLGDTSDLHEFLFGRERMNLARIASMLRELQNGICFYCARPLRGESYVDHFVPWAMYPVDLGHNFVLAHQQCNSAKSDHLAAEVHLAAWTRRNSIFGNRLEQEFERLKVPYSLDASLQIAAWAYGTTAKAGGMVWVRSNELVGVSQEWTTLLTGAGTKAPAAAPA